MKKFTFKGVLDGFRSTVQQQSYKPEQEIQETLKPEHFIVKKVSGCLNNFSSSIPNTWPSTLLFSKH